MAAGKRQTLITTAIAREMAAFLWAIGQEVHLHKVGEVTFVEEGRINLD
jgi:hypothetical protein